MNDMQLNSYSRARTRSIFRHFNFSVHHYAGINFPTLLRFRQGLSTW
jgi:hypothetical protein